MTDSLTIAATYEISLACLRKGRIDSWSDDTRLHRNLEVCDC